MEFTAAKPVILASASPRRKELMEKFGFPFAVIPSKNEEPDPADFESAVEYVQQCAEQKAAEVAQAHTGSLVIGADTVVVLDGHVLLKPKDEHQAREYLWKLSGNTHEVITAVVLIDERGVLPFYERTEVTFYPLREEWVEAYIKSGDPFDKAGAYGIQTSSGLFVKKINGDYNNVVGLPLSHLSVVLQDQKFVSVKGYLNG